MGKVSLFGTRGHWTVYAGRVTVGRFTRKSEAEALIRKLKG